MDPENVDAMTPKELRQAERVFKALALYARRKRLAFIARRNGRIASALALEAECERIYGELPESHRW